MEFLFRSNLGLVDLCPICSWEHLGDAEVVMIHAKSTSDPARIIEKAADASMYLRQAEFQSPDPALAQKIRELRYKVEGPVFGQKYDDLIGTIIELDELRKEAQKKLPQAEEGASAAHKKAHKERVHSEEELQQALASEVSEEKGASTKYEKTAEALEAEGLAGAAKKIRKVAHEEARHEKVVEEVEKEHQAQDPPHVLGTAPFGWTQCEQSHPAVQRKIEACVLEVKAKGQDVNPFAVCRASVKCPSK